MWNLTPDYIQQIKEELKGRRAAIEARYADELKALASDLDEIEELERLAYSFAVKHLASSDLPAPSEEAGTAAVPDGASANSSDGTPADPPGRHPVELAHLQSAPAEPMEDVASEAKTPSRWRLRSDA